jgi:hypothetical protein
MGMRYRKSIKIGGVRVNLNKKCIGVSAGVPGFRVSANTKGQRRTTVSAPGTGLSYVSQSKSKKQPKASPGRKATQPRSAAPAPASAETRPFRGQDREATVSIRLTRKRRCRASELGSGN